MTDREKVLNQLAGIGIGLDMAGYHNDAQCVRDALALLREQERPGWISVQDRLPEKDGRYLVWFERTKAWGWVSPAIGYYWHDTLGFSSQYNTRGVNMPVAYWMPLPEQPKEVSGDG